MVGRTVVIRCRRADVTAQLAKKGIGPVEIDVADLESGNPRARRCCRRVPISTLSSPRRARDCLRTCGTRPTSRLRRTTIAVDAVGTLLGHRRIDRAPPCARARPDHRRQLRDRPSPFPVLPTYGASMAAAHALQPGAARAAGRLRCRGHRAVPPAVATRVWGSNPHALALDGTALPWSGGPGGEPGVFSSASSRAVRRLISPSRMRVLIVLRGTPSMALACG